MDNKFRNTVIAVCGLLSVAVAGSIGEAAKSIHHVRHINTYNCTNPAFYDGNKGWCNAAYRVGYVKALPTAERMEDVRREKAERRAQAQARLFPPVQTYDEVTTYRDRQAPTDTGNPDPFIRLQTAENVANSSPWYAATAAAWNPGSLVLGVQRVARTLTEPNRREVVETVRTDRTVTTRTKRYDVLADGQR